MATRLSEHSLVEELVTMVERSAAVAASKDVAPAFEAAMARVACSRSLSRVGWLLSATSIMG